MEKESTQQEFNNKVLHESFDFKDITWTICNVLSLPETVGYRVRSSSFPFANANWELGMYPYGEEEDTEGYIDLEIKRLNSVFPEHHVFYKVCIITNNEKESECYSTSQLFEPDSTGWGIANYLQKTELIEMASTLAPNGNLTINCQMRVKKTAGIDKSSQIGSAARRSDSGDIMEPSDLSLPLLDNKIFQDFKKLFLSQDDYDVIIKVKGVEFPAHRLILTARSPVFASTFRNDMKEKSTGIIDIEDCDPSTFSDFLSFLYCGVLGNLSTENVFSIFTAADKYDVQDLRVKCVEFMKANISVDTFCDTITIAIQHSEAELVKLSTNFFAKNLQEIIQTVKWQMFLAENPTESNELLIKALVTNKSSK